MEEQMMKDACGVAVPCATSVTIETAANGFVVRVAPHPMMGIGPLGGMGPQTHICSGHGELGELLARILGPVGA